MGAELYWSAQNFVAGWDMYYHGSDIIVYLKGATTYYFRPRMNNVALKNTEAKDSKVLGHQTKTSTTTVGSDAARSGVHHEQMTLKNLKVDKIENGRRRLDIEAEDVRVDGAVTAHSNYVVSDATVKKEVIQATGALDLVKRLRGVTHRYRDDVPHRELRQMDEVDSNADPNADPAGKTEMGKTGSEHPDMDPKVDPEADPKSEGKGSEDKEEKPVKMKRFPTGRHYGFIAQEVEEVVPELVKTLPEGLKAVQYEKLSVLLTEAVKEMSTTIADLRGTVDKLSKEVAALKKEKSA